MIEKTLEAVIAMIGFVYLIYLLFFNENWKEFIITTIVAFVMVIGTLIIGKYMLGVW